MEKTKYYKVLAILLGIGLPPLLLNGITLFILSMTALPNIVYVVVLVAVWTLLSLAVWKALR